MEFGVSDWRFGTRVTEDEATAEAIAAAMVASLTWVVVLFVAVVLCEIFAAAFVSPSLLPREDERLDDFLFFEAFNLAVPSFQAGFEVFSAAVALFFLLEEEEVVGTTTFLLPLLP